MNVLVAGGAGYIGSHTVKRLTESGHSPVIYDNCSRGHREVADILKVPAIFSDLNDRKILTQALRDHKIDCVMHFAAFAYVGESVEKPLMYYWNKRGDDDQRAGVHARGGREPVRVLQHLRSIRQSGARTTD
jgi:UDP-glucose 4-epimerase